MVHELIKINLKRCVPRIRKKGKHQQTFEWHIGGRLHAEAECRKVYAGKVFE